MKSMKLVEFVHRLVPACNSPSSSSSLLEHKHSKKPVAAIFFIRRLHSLLLACNMHHDDDGDDYNYKTTTTTTKTKYKGAKHHHGDHDKKKKKKQYSDELSSLKFVIEKIHQILYGDTETLPDQKARTEFTVEMFKESPTSVNHTFRLLITCFKKIDLESKKGVVDIVANLLGQTVNSRLIACEYLEENLDIIDVLIKGSFDFYESDDPSVALLYGSMLRVSIRRSQIVARHVLESEKHVHVKKFLEEVQHPDFTIASFVTTTLEYLLTRHKSTVSDFLTNNSEWLFDHFNSKLLQSSQNLLTRFHALKIMENMLLNVGKDHVVMIRFLSSEQNMKIMMNLLREIVEKMSQLDKVKEDKKQASRQNEKYVQAKRSAFNIFKLFVDDQNKTEKVVKILSLNKEKICKFLAEEFKIDTEDEQSENDKTTEVIREIEAL